MAWPYSGYALVYMLSALASLVVAAICWQRRRQPGAAYLAGMMVALSFWAMGDAIDLVATAPAAKLLGGKLAALGVATSPVFFLLATLDFSGRRRWLAPHRVALLFVIPAITILLALTDEVHGLLWGSYLLNPGEPKIMLYGQGPWLWLHLLYSYGLSLLAVLVLVQVYLRQHGLYRLQVLALLAAAMAALLTSLLYLAPFNPIPGADFAPLAFTVTGTILAFSIARLQLFDLAPVARELVIETMADAVLVLDEKQRIVDLNPAAQALLAQTPRQAIGQPIAAVLPALATVTPGAPAILELVAGTQAHVYDLHASPLHGRAGNNGQVVVLHDVTEQRQLAAALQRLNADLESAVAERTARLSAAVVSLEQEIAERRRAEAQLRAMHESLAGHVAGLSHKLGALYEVILFGGQAMAIPAIQAKALDIILEAMGSDAGFVATWDDGEAALLFAVQRGFGAGELAQLAQIAPPWLLTDRVPRSIRDLAGDASVPAALRLPGFRAYLGQPTVLHNRPTGALGIFWREPHLFAVEDVALFSALADQLAIVVENARLRAERETAVVREERRRLARDLHDSVTQTLYGLAVAADTANNRARQGQTARVGGLLEQVASAAQQALREMRLLLYELHLATPNEMNLADALQLRLDAVEQRAGLDAHLLMDANLRLPKALERELYWIAMEALNNALKHAQATQVTLRIWETAGMLEMEIADDGIGIETPVRPGGLGLNSMAERARRLGGAVTVDGSDATGTRVHLRIPAPFPDPVAA